jgi:hypothetical protein
LTRVAIYEIEADRKNDIDADVDEDDEVVRFNAVGEETDEQTYAKSGQQI